MEKTKPFKVAVIGTGSSAHDHAAAFKQAGVEIAAVVGRNDRQRHAFASKFGVPIQANEYQEVLDIPDIDAVAICLPNYLHAPVAVEAMRAGKHVLTEKPMALDGAAAEEMVRVQRETGKTLMVSLQVRYSPAARLARQYAAEFGSIYYGKCAYLRRSGIPGWGSWFTRKDQAGGGPIVDVAIHVLDECLYLMGSPKPLYVTARTYAEFGPKGLGKGQYGTQDPNGYCDVEDLAAALITLDNGAVISLETSWAYHGPDKRSVEIFGSEGGLSLAMLDDLIVYKNQFGTPVTLRPDIPAQDERVNMATHFVECCTTGKTPETSAEHGLMLSKLFDAMYKSSAEGGRQVKIEL